MTNNDKKILNSTEKSQLITTLKTRFEKNKNRHKGLDWQKIQFKLELPSSREKLWSLFEMERTGGEPDVVGYDSKTDEYLFFDCAEESPKGRRSICYDREGLDSRKEFKPENNAIDMATEMGIQILTEEEYRELQKLGNPASPTGGFDNKTSSWLKTPEDIRKLGGAIYADFRYGHVFVYHNGAQSYYSVRGFRGSLRV